MVEMFATWPQCQSILLGVSHDNGYARVLSKLETDHILPGRVRLLQGPPLAAELAQLSPSSFPRVEFGNIFMASKLEPERRGTYVQVAMDGVLKLSPKTSPIEAVNNSTSRLGLPDKGKSFSFRADATVSCLFVSERFKTGSL